MPFSATSGSLISLQVLDVVLDPVITGVGTYGMALFGHEAVEQKGEGSPPEASSRREVRAGQPSRANSSPT